MTIAQVIAMAKNGDLKTLSIKTDEETILGFFNLGLIELYKRFPLKVSEYIVNLQDAVSVYDLPEDFMWIVSAYREVPSDNPTPFVALGINEEDNPNSINTPSWNKVQIPMSANGAFVSIIYAAAPILCEYNPLETNEKKFFYVDENNVTKYDAAIPPQMVEAMLEFISYKANSAYNTPGDPNANLFYQRFENSCARIEQRGMFSTDDLDMLARGMKGFV